MTDVDDVLHPEDAELTAFLDGELSAEAHADVLRRLSANPALQRRVFLLSAGNRPFRKAFDALLDDAPKQRLNDMLVGLLNATDPAQSRPLGRGKRKATAAAAAVMLFVAGLAAGHWGPTLAERLTQIVASSDQSDEDWRREVAEYLSFETSDTLSSIPDDPLFRQRSLVNIGDKIGVPLSSETVAIPGLAFKRAQLFDYDDKLMAHMTYLEPEHGPVVLCIVTKGGHEQAPQTEQHGAFNAVYWTKRGRNFMLIGKVPPPRLDGMVAQITEQLDG